MTCCSKEIWASEKKELKKLYFGLIDLRVIEWSVNGYTLK